MDTDTYSKSHCVVSDFINGLDSSYCRSNGAAALPAHQACHAHTFSASYSGSSWRWLAVIHGGSVYITDTAHATDEGFVFQRAVKHLPTYCWVGEKSRERVV